jgi:hypothetical protein
MPKVYINYYDVSYVSYNILGTVLSIPIYNFLRQDFIVQDAMDWEWWWSNNYWEYKATLANNLSTGYSYKLKFRGQHQEGTTENTSETMFYWNGDFPSDNVFDPGSEVRLFGYKRETWLFNFVVINKSAKSYTLTIINNNGVADSTATHYYNTSVTVYAGSKPGHRFVKFTSNFGDISNGGSFIWNRDSNETLTSVWEIIRYTVTFEKRINDPPRTSYVIPSYITQDYNTAVTFPIFKAIGYTFVRWVDVNNYTYTTINNLTGDITLYAFWQKKDTITFTELNRVYNGTRGSNPPDRGAPSISIGKFRTESGRGATESIKLITHFQGKGL